MPQKSVTGLTSGLWTKIDSFHKYRLSDINERREALGNSPEQASVDWERCRRLTDHMLGDLYRRHNDAAPEIVRSFQKDASFWNSLRRLLHVSSLIRLKYLSILSQIVALNNRLKAVYSPQLSHICQAYESTNPAQQPGKNRYVRLAPLVDASVANYEQGISAWSTIRDDQ